METPSRRRDGPVRTTLVAIGLAAFGILASQFTVLPAFVLEPALVTAPAEASLVSRTVLLILNFLGFVLAGALYLAATDRGWSYVDLRWPTKRGWLYVLAGILGSFVFYILVSLVVQALALPSAENQVSMYIGNDQTMVLIMIGIVFFFNAPAEEFLFRNIVQKRLYAAFDRLTAVVVASAIFALIHIMSYAFFSDSLLATLVPVMVVFGGSIIFGLLYAKTDNLVVPIAAHAAFNAIQFGLLYLALEYDLETADPSSMSLLVDVVATLPL
ncbi:lysostaphin resistance A-like protein [Natrinema sp. HArc-T2]|uniref:CPBP family intramembrane glutamic endopeptidase n=1 Tax=Natrinema sp. HArc-T2 TaxID=3242701 RepID=UPI00359E4DC9